MSTRLQVVLEDAEIAVIRRTAKARHQTVSEWVRQALRSAQQHYPESDAERKVQVVREAVDHNYPVADIDSMLREIDQGYSGGSET